MSTSSRSLTQIKGSSLAFDSDFFTVLTTLSIRGSVAQHWYRQWQADVRCATQRRATHRQGRTGCSRRFSWRRPSRGSASLKRRRRSRSRCHRHRPKHPLDERHRTLTGARMARKLNEGSKGGALWRFAAAFAARAAARFNSRRLIPFGERNRAQHVGSLTQQRRCPRSQRRH